MLLTVGQIVQKSTRKKTVMSKMKYYSETVNIKYEFQTEEKYSKNTY